MVKKKIFEGQVKPGQEVAIVDDVITTGNSIIAALGRCEKNGIKVRQIIALMDRQEGGLEMIEKSVNKDTKIDVLFSKSEITSQKSASNLTALAKLNKDKIKKDKLKIILDYCQRIAENGGFYYEHRENLSEEEISFLKDSLLKLGYKLRITTRDQLLHNCKHMFDLHFQNDIRDRIAISWGD